MYSADDLQGGQLEIWEDRGSNAWATTRTISVRMMESPRSIQEHCKLICDCKSETTTDLVTRAAGLLRQRDTEQT